MPGRSRHRLAPLALLVALPLLPLPWRAAPPSAGPGTAWRLDGRLEIAEEPVDPPGTVLWLAAGRPQLLGERVREVVTGRATGVPLLRGDAATTSGVAVPAVTAAALAAAGLPADAAATARLTLRAGPLDLGRLTAGLHLGDSHGLAVAVAVLRAEGVLDLGTATVAATGRVGPDGTVLPVGGIGPKVGAAVRSGATEILVPRDQEELARAVRTDRPIRVRGVGHLSELLDPPPASPRAGTAGTQASSPDGT